MLSVCCNNHNIKLVEKRRKTAFEIYLTDKEFDFANAIKKSIDKVRDKVKLKDIKDSLSVNVATYFSEDIDWNALDDIIKEDLKEVLLEMVWVGADKELKTLKPVISKAIDIDAVNVIVPEIPFTLRNPRILSKIEERAYNIGSSMVSANAQVIEKVVRLNYERGYNASDIAPIVKGMVGLNERQSIALDNYSIGLRKQGLNPMRINKLVKSYSDKLLSDRAMNIARTEVMTGVNLGQTEVWNEAFNAGYLDKGKYVKEVNTALDDLTCDICEPLNGQRVDLDDNFVTELGGIDSPPFHNQCRCLKSLVFLEG